MTDKEKLFFLAYGFCIFPLLLILLAHVGWLDKTLVSPFLIFMASLKAVYLGARGFDNWNSTPDNVVDDGGH